MENLKSGDHFWGIIDKRLAVFIKTKHGYYIAGAWECEISADKISFVSKIDLPKGREKTKTYYA